MLPRPTVRGWVTAGLGAALAVLGAVTGTLDLVRIGLVGFVLVIGAGMVIAGGSFAGHRRALAVQRTVAPNPLHVGASAHATVRVTARGVTARSRLAGMRFAEQASSELSGGRPLRAHVERSGAAVDVHYTVRAARRGRWTLGPLVVTRGDVFGVVRTQARVGPVEQVAVWPAIVALPAPNQALVGEPDRVALGARAPSTDDASLRDYREGDDLRRVHWRSSAHRGVLLVRSDERAGMRAVTVLLDTPVGPAAAEWSISLAASMAVAMLDAGHPVRLIGAGPAGTDPPPGFHHARSGPQARAALLDPLVDLIPPRTEAEAQQRLADAVRMVQTVGRGDDILLAVLGTLPPNGRADVAGLAGATHAWAVVRGGSRPADDAGAVLGTLRALHRAGWHATRASAGEPIVECWTRLLEVPR
ncbi:MAG: DUF58 domain-containing protein [Micrococcales bacterium]|nr:DUF58 domain-containing protein [Micrococcales bacterium]